MDITEMRPKLPNDARGRSWAVALPDDGGNQVLEKAVVCTLVAYDDDFQVHVLGSAFVIGASGDRALCMCAAHSIEQAKAFESARQPRSAWNAPPDLAFPTPNYFYPCRIKAFFYIAGEAVTCDVEQLNYIAGNDLSLISVVSPRSRDLFQDRFSINFAVPAAGTEVAVISNQITLTRQENSTKINLSLQMRHGVVTDVEFGKGIAGQSSIFYTTIPMSGGMSGSPVIAWSGPDAPAIVRGVVSSDMSLEESHNDFLVPGRSAISMLWPSYGLGIKARRDATAAAEYCSIADLVRMKFIDDRTSGARVEVLSQDRNWTEIAYDDPVHGTFVLRVTSHPDAGQ
jgi:hypothetical protein